MAIDLEAIRKKVQQLQGGRRSSRVQFWKVGPRTEAYKVRALPWPAEVLKDGQPFVERWFYYIGDNPGILAPFQFGKEDPISDLRKKLYDSGDPSDREIAKKLRPKMRCYLPVLERGKEADGIKVWSFGKIVYQRLLNFFLKEDIGDWMDPKTGFDIEVTISRQDGKLFNDTAVDLARRESRLADTDDEIAALVEAVPNINDMYRERSTEEIEKILSDWLNGGEATEGDGESRNDSKGTDALDDLVNEVKGATAEKPTEEPKSEEKTKKARSRKNGKKKAAASADADLDALATDGAPAQSLDKAFEELMED